MVIKYQNRNCPLPAACHEVTSIVRPSKCKSLYDGLIGTSGGGLWLKECYLVFDRSEDILRKRRRWRRSLVSLVCAEGLRCFHAVGRYWWGEGT